jgi:DNA-binding LytR/AlgR family response regulator
MQTLDLKPKFQQLKNLREIIYIEAIGEFSNIYRADGTKEFIQENFITLKRDLPSDKFIQIHDLYMINADYIKKVRGNLTRYVLLKDDLEIVLSPEHYDNFLGFLKLQYVI